MVRRDKLYGAADLFSLATIASVIVGRKRIMIERGQSCQVYLPSDRLTSHLRRSRGNSILNSQISNLCREAAIPLSHPLHGFFHGARHGLAEEAVHGIPGDEPGAARFPAVPFLHTGGGMAGAGGSASYDAAVPVPYAGGFDGGEHKEKGI